MGRLLGRCDENHEKTEMDDYDETGIEDDRYYVFSLKV